MKASMRSRLNHRLAIGLLAAVVFSGCVRVDSGGAGVLWTFMGGTQEATYGEGVHIVAPWNRMYVYDVRTQDRLETLQILTSNGLSVGLELSIRFHPMKEELPLLHQTIGPAYYDKIVKPSLRSEARKVVGEYTPEEIYSSKRLEVADNVRDVMIVAVEGKHIVIETVLLRDVALPAKLKVAIEAKLEEEQAALKMKFVLDREGREAERKRIEAQGIADFQRIVAKGISPLLLQWKGIEATEKLASSPNAKVVVIGSGQDGLPLILGGAN